MWHISLALFIKPKKEVSYTVGQLWKSLPSSTFLPQLVNVTSGAYEQYWPVSSGRYLPMPEGNLIAGEEYLTNFKLTTLSNKGLPESIELQDSISNILQTRDAFGVFIWGNFLTKINYQENDLVSDKDLWCFRANNGDTFSPFAYIKISYPVPLTDSIAISIQTLSPYPHFIFADEDAGELLKQSRDARLNWLGNIRDPSPQQLRAGKSNWSRFVRIMAELQRASNILGEQIYPINLTVEGGGIVHFADNLATIAKGFLGEIELEKV